MNTADDTSFFALAERYPDEQSAIDYFTERRWPDGPYCNSCGSVDVYDCKARRRLPLYKCRDCGKQFSVISGTVMEGTKLPLKKWLWAYHMLGGAKKSLSARYIARHLGLSLRSAWHLTHRIRASMAENKQIFTGVVETDETYIGGRRKHVGRGYRKNKIAVQTIVQRPKRYTFGNDKRRSRYTPEQVGQAQTIALDPLAENVDGRTVGAKLRKHTVPGKTVLMTDESPIYGRVGESYKEHHTVNHRKEDYAHYADDGHLVHTNTAEGLFANLKRQVTGTHHHVSKKHLPRYLEEYDYKYNTRNQSDTERTEAAIGRIEGKRVRLFKSETGAAGDSLHDRKASEPSESVTQRGQHMRAQAEGRAVARMLDLIGEEELKAAAGGESTGKRKRRKKGGAS